jgi:hypothetical protein
MFLIEENVTFRRFKKNLNSLLKDLAAIVELFWGFYFSGRASACVGSESESKPELRIRDIFVRIRIRGSVPLTDPDSDPTPASRILLF